MCDKSKNCGCSDCSNSNSSTQNNSSTTNKVENVYNTLPGHPIIMIDEPSDTELFSVSTGEGSGIWEGWALMDGKTHYDINNGKAAIVCADMMDRCPVMSGNTYEIGDTFGTATHALVAAENGTHNHAITDTGHTHTLNDPGHSHTLNDPGHSHDLINTLYLNSNIASASHIESSVQVDSGSGPDVPDTWTDYSAGLGGSISVDSNTTGITEASSATGATVASAATGISLADSGAGNPHENRQPSYALLFIKRIYVPV